MRVLQAIRVSLDFGGGIKSHTLLYAVSNSAMASLRERISSGCTDINLRLGGTLLTFLGPFALASPPSLANQGSRKKSICDPVNSTLHSLHFRLPERLPPSSKSSFRCRTPNLVILSTMVASADWSSADENTLRFRPFANEGLAISMASASAKARCSLLSSHAPTVPVYR